MNIVFKEFLIALVISVAASLLIGGVIYWTKAERCENRATKMGLKHDFAMLQGCMVGVDKHWAPIEYIRIVDDKVIIQGDGE